MIPRARITLLRQGLPLWHKASHEERTYSGPGGSAPPDPPKVHRRIQPAGGSGKGSGWEPATASLTPPAPPAVPVARAASAWTACGVTPSCWAIAVHVSPAARSSSTRAISRARSCSRSRRRAPRASTPRGTGEPLGALRLAAATPLAADLPRERLLNLCRPLGAEARSRCFPHLAHAAGGPGFHDLGCQAFTQVVNTHLDQPSVTTSSPLPYPL